MTRYQLRDAVVEARQFLPGGRPTGLVDGVKWIAGSTYGIIRTPHGSAHVRPGDWVVTWPDGLTHVYPDATFHRLFEPCSRDMGLPVMATTPAPPRTLESLVVDGLATIPTEHLARELQRRSAAGILVLEYEHGRPDGLWGRHCWGGMAAALGLATLAAQWLKSEEWLTTFTGDGSDAGDVDDGPPPPEPV